MQRLEEDVYDIWKWKGKKVIVDGANIARTLHPPDVRLGYISLVVSKAEKMGLEPVVIVDASLWRDQRLDDRNGLQRMIDSGKVIQVSAGSSADNRILNDAEKLDAAVISRDVFKGWVHRYPWIQEYGRLYGAELSLDGEEACSMPVNYYHQRPQSGARVDIRETRRGRAALPSFCYLAKIKELDADEVEFVLLHKVLRNTLDLLHLDAPLTFRIDDETYNTLLAFKGAPLIIDPVRNTVTASAYQRVTPPVQKVVLQLEERENSFATLCVAKEYAASLYDRIAGMNFHWNHKVDDEVHEMHVEASLVPDFASCDYCSRISMKKAAECRRCTDRHRSRLWGVSYDVLGMITLSFFRLDSGGDFKVQPDLEGHLVVQCKGFSVETSVIEIQNMLESAITP